MPQSKIPPFPDLIDHRRQWSSPHSRTAPCHVTIIDTRTKSQTSMYTGTGHSIPTLGDRQSLVKQHHPYSLVSVRIHHVARKKTTERTNDDYRNFHTTLRAATDDDHIASSRLPTSNSSIAPIVHTHTHPTLPMTYHADNDNDKSNAMRRNELPHAQHSVSRARDSSRCVPPSLYPMEPTCSIQGHLYLPLTSNSLHICDRPFPIQTNDRSIHAPSPKRRLHPRQ